MSNSDSSAKTRVNITYLKTCGSSSFMRQVLKILLFVHECRNGRSCSHLRLAAKWDNILVDLELLPPGKSNNFSRKDKTVHRS